MRPSPDEHTYTKAGNHADSCAVVRKRVHRLYLAAPLDAQTWSPVQTQLSLLTDCFYTSSTTTHKSLQPSSNLSDGASPLGRNSMSRWASCACLRRLSAAPWGRSRAFASTAKNPCRLMPVLFTGPSSYLVAPIHDFPRYLRPSTGARRRTKPACPVSLSNHQPEPIRPVFAMPRVTTGRRAAATLMIWGRFCEEHTTEVVVALVSHCPADANSRECAEWRSHCNP
jgi:hypothetical protein